MVFAFIFVLAFTSVGYLGIPGWWKYTHEQVSPLVNDGAPDLLAVAARPGANIRSARTGSAATSSP